MSDYKMVPVVATEEMLAAVGLRDMPCVYLGAGFYITQRHARELYEKMAAEAPPFVVTDEVAERVIQAYHDTNVKQHPAAIAAMRAAIEAVLGGGE